jgi:hypothetical protein
MTTKERYAMVVESGASMMTVVKWDKGRKIQPALEKYLTETAVKLGLIGERAVAK